MADSYDLVGFSKNRTGFGTCPAIAVVDFQLAFTDDRYPLGGSAMVNSAVEHTARLLKVARAAGCPVLNCYTSYTSSRDAQYWKIPTVVEQFHHGHPCTKLDSRIYDADFDTIICKAAPSLFFQTAAISLLVKEQVDTVVVSGCNTSGCIRATVNDAFSYGFRVVVPEECVGDVEEGPHNDNLRDVGRRYADIVSVTEVIRYLEKIKSDDGSLLSDEN